MGEIADMMLNGEMCEACGEWLGGEADGFPRYCSRQCAEVRGALKCEKPKKKAATVNKCPKGWSDVKAKIEAIAKQHGLNINWRNPEAPNYEIAMLSSPDIRLVVYPHTTRNTGNRHARIRNQGSTNIARAREIMIASGFAVKLGGLPEVKKS